MATGHYRAEITWKVSGQDWQVSDAQEFDVAPRPGNIYVVSGLELQPDPSHDWPPVEGDKLIGRFTLGNNGGQTVHLEGYGVRMRRDGWDYWDFLYPGGGVDLAPGQTVRFDQNNERPLATGHYRAEITWKVSGQDWQVTDAQEFDVVVPGQLELVDDLSLRSDGSGAWPPHVGDKLIAHIRVRNAGDQSLHVEHIGVRGRRNGSENWDIGFWTIDLEGHQEWSLDPNNERPLQEGSYSFRVTYSLDGSNWTEIGNEVNFTVSPPGPYSISGHVRDRNNDPISGVTISDGAGHTATTDSNGDYTLSGLTDGTYTLMPSKSEWTFTPSTRTVSVPPSATGQDFMGWREPTPTPTPPSGLIYDGPHYLPADKFMVGEADRRITMGDHVHLRLPFRNIGSQPLSNVTVEMLGGQWTGSSPGVSIHNGTTWANQQVVSLTPAVIGPGETGIADFWIYVTDNDPVNRRSLKGQTWLQVRTDAGKWTIGITLSPISFAISGNEALKSGSCLHNPGNPEIQKYAQYAAGAWTMNNTPPTNASDPDTPDQAVRNLVGRVAEEFHFRDNQTFRVPDTTLLVTRRGYIGACRHYADLTTGLLRSLGLPTHYISAQFFKPFYQGSLHPGKWRPGHAWVEVYLGEGGWRQADSTPEFNTAFYEGIYEIKGYTVREAWADRYPLSAGFYNYCIAPCYQPPVDCTRCKDGIESYGEFRQDLGCVEDVRSRYHNVGAQETMIAAASDEQLLIHLQNPTFVTRTVPFTLTTGIVNSTALALNAITATVAINEYVDSTAPLFDVTPSYQLAANMNPGQTVTVTWVVTPLVTGSGIPLRVTAEGDGFFDFAVHPLVVNEPDTLPDLSLNGVCSLGTVLPGQTITLTASVLDERLQPITDTDTLVTAAISSIKGFSTFVSLPYCAACDAFQQTVNIPTTAPIGSYRVDFTASRAGYESAQSTVYFFVAPPLSVTLTTNRDTFDRGDMLTLTVRVLDRGTMVAEANVLAEIQTPGGVVIIPVPYDTDGNYVASLRPADLAPNLNGCVVPGTWQILAEADYSGATSTAQEAVGVRAPIYLPIIMKHHVPGPDLVVDSLVATSDAVTVTIKNQGNAPVPDDAAYEFWVDLYINPSREPIYNDTCQTMGCQGAAWGITWSGDPHSPPDPARQALPLEPGEVFTLTTHGDYYWWSKEGITWPLTQGASVYAQVDSASDTTSYGAVLESNENNNVSGPFTVQSFGATSPPVPSPDEGPVVVEEKPEEDISKTSLPPRP